MWNPRYRGPTVHRIQQKKYWRENTNTRAEQEAGRHGTGGTGSEVWGGALGLSLRWHQHLSWVSLSHLQDVFLQVEATGTCSTKKWQTLLYFRDNTEGFREQFWLWFSNYEPSLEANSPLRCSLPLYLSPGLALTVAFQWWRKRGPCFLFLRQAQGLAGSRSRNVCRAAHLGRRHTEAGVRKPSKEESFECWANRVSLAMEVWSLRNVTEEEAVGTDETWQQRWENQRRHETPKPQACRNGSLSHLALP